MFSAEIRALRRCWCTASSVGDFSDTEDVDDAVVLGKTETDGVDTDTTEGAASRRVSS
jgi:hypothetical protein